MPTSLLKCKWIAVMAIYHFSAKLISRANGSSALAAAAYRSASRLHDERLDRHHDFSNKAGVVHSEVMLPDGAPEQMSDRAALWNAVEAVEKRVNGGLRPDPCRGSSGCGRSPLLHPRPRARS